MKVRTRTNNIFIETFFCFAAQVVLIFLVIALWVFMTILAVFAICLAPFKDEQLFDLIGAVLEKLEQINYNDILRGK